MWVKIMPIVGMILMYLSTTELVVSAKSTSGATAGGNFFGMFIGAIIGAALVLVPLIFMSKTKKKATEANDYVKLDNGGDSNITSRQDRHIKSYTETRNK